MTATRLLGAAALAAFAAAAGCTDDPQINAVTGALAGAAVGSTIGSGSGQTAAILGGAAVGAAVGGNTSITN